jgi:hypothetical protein
LIRSIVAAYQANRLDQESFSQFTRRQDDGQLRELIGNSLQTIDAC